MSNIHCLLLTVDVELACFARVAIDAPALGRGSDRSLVDIFFCVGLFRIHGFQRDPPARVLQARGPFFIGSLAVLFYGQVLDEAVTGWKDLVVLCAIGGQWVTPLGIYFSATLTATTSVGLLTLIGHTLHVLAAVSLSIAYLRHRTNKTTTSTEVA